MQFTSTVHFRRDFILLALCVIGGCGSPASAPSITNQTKAAPGVVKAVPLQAEFQPAKPPQPETKALSIPLEIKPTSPVTPREPPRSLGQLVAEQATALPEELFNPARFEMPEVKEELCAARGIRKLTSKHLILYTDLPAAPAVDELPELFDLAVPIWADYFEVPLERLKDWRFMAVLAKSKDLFVNTGLWPEDLPSFLNAFTRGAQCWCEEQSSDYYRRHLLLHEGTHGFMYACFDHIGPPWYGEGVAELLATHRMIGKQLHTRLIPISREESLAWGRIKIIKEDLQHNRGLVLPEVMQYPPFAFREVEPYAWSWAASVFCDGDPELRKPFRAMRKHLTAEATPFATELWNTANRPAAVVAEDWQWFIMNLDYGYDRAREKIMRSAKTTAIPSPAEFTLDCTRGWQSTGWELRRGVTYEISAPGQFQIAEQGGPWISEANGVTLRYHRGQPLGMLLAAVTDTGKSPGLSPLLTPQPVGAFGTITPDRDGVLYVRINDSPAEWHDNLGKIPVQVREQ